MLVFTTCYSFTIDVCMGLRVLPRTDTNYQVPYHWDSFPGLQTLHRMKKSSTMSSWRDPGKMAQWVKYVMYKLWAWTPRKPGGRAELFSYSEIGGDKRIHRSWVILNRVEDQRPCSQARWKVKTKTSCPLTFDGSSCTTTFIDSGSWSLQWVESLLASTVFTLYREQCIGVTLSFHHIHTL